MALPADPAPRTRARAPRSIHSPRRTGSTLVPAFVLARMSLLVLLGRASVDVARMTSDQDRIDHRRRTGTGRRALLVLGHDGDLAAFAAAQQAVADDSDSASTRGEFELPATPVPAGEERLLDVRRAGSTAAMRTTSTTLVVAGVIGLLGVAGAAAFIVDSIAAPVRRAVRVLHAPADHRLRLVTRDESPTPAGVVSADAEQLPTGQAVAAAIGEIVPDVAEPTSVVPVIAGVVAQARLALEATLQEAAKIAEAAAAGSTVAARDVGTTRFAAARGRALGPTTALWHAVQLDRLVGAIEGACETTVCGSLVRMSTEQEWPVVARNVCPACATLAH